MQIRTLTGTTIAEALSEARAIWGDAVVMLQAEPPAAGRSARIAVSVPSAPTRASSSVDVMVLDQPEPAAMTPLTPAPGALRRQGKAAALLLDEDRIRPAIGFFEHIATHAKDEPAAGDAPVDMDLPGTVDAVAAAAAPAPEPAALPTEKITRPDMDPRFATLVSRGIRPTRAQRLCRAAAPEAGVEGLVGELAAQLPESASGTPGRIVFLGEAGSGKTTLVLRSALSRIRAGRTAPTVVVVAPSREDFPVWQDPTPLFESFGLEAVRCGAEALASALTALPGDVLVDAPASFRLPKGVDLHARLVVDARSAGSATAREGDGADSVILTHLDRTATPGYAAERIIAMNLPVAALIAGARPTEGAAAYSPERFARMICDA